MGSAISPLARINKDNVKNLKLAYAVPLGGTVGNGFLQATPLADDGFLYIDRLDGACSTRSTARRATPAASSGAWTPSRTSSSATAAPALVGQSRDHRRRRPAAHHCDQQGNRPGRLGDERSRKRRTRRSPPRRWRSRTRSSSVLPAATMACATGSPRLDAATGKRLWKTFTIPAPGEPGSETWKDKNNAWQTGGGALWVTGTYDPDDQPEHLGHRQPGADVRSDLSARRQPLHQQRDLL